MPKYKVEFVEDLPEELSEKMDENLIAYEHSHGIDVNYRLFAVVLSDENNNAVGILNAYTAFAEIYIDNIWVDSSQRGKGFGTILMTELENNFKGQGYNNINLVTSAFQAPEFYKKCGFTEEFVRVNKKNPKLSKSFFVKYFDDEEQTQGILEN